MTPEQLTALTGFLNLLSNWPVWASMIVVCVVGPWIALLLLSRGQEKRFSEQKQMYDSNVELVKTTQILAKDLKEIITYNTQVMTQVRDIAENNLYCPLNRRQVKQKEVDIKKEVDG